MISGWDLCYNMGIIAERNSKGQFIKGHKPLNVGEQHRKAMSKIAKEKGYGKWMTGRKLSEETKRKVRENSARYWQGKERPEMKGNDFAKGKTPWNKGKKGVMPTAWNKGKFGKESSSWKEIKRNPLRQSIRQLFQYHQWRSNVFKRDNYTCLFCKRKKEVGGKLEADHYPKSFAELIADINIVDEAINHKDLWDIDNGRTLCQECHKTTDNYLWKARMK